MSNPPLHPLEEEALRRVRANLLSAMRASERAPSRRERNARRRITMFGVAAASAVAAGVIAFVLADPSEHDANVDTVQGETVVTTAAAPATSVTRPAVTTTTTAPPPPPAPVDFVAVTVDGRLVVVDAATRTELRELARRADPRQASGEIAPNTITGVTVDRANGIVYYETCCEPAVGDVWSVPLAGGKSTQVTNMSSPAVSAGGRYLAGLAANSLWLIDRQTGAVQTREDDGFGFHTAISPDAALVAYERSSTAGSDDLRSELVVLGESVLDSEAAEQQAAGAFTNPRVWRDPEGIGWMFPAVNRDGNVVVAQQCCYGSVPIEGATSARVIDPNTGQAVGSWSYPTPVADQEYDASGSWLLVTLVDGRVVWYGGGTSGELAPGFLAADW